MISFMIGIALGFISTMKIPVNTKINEIYYNKQVNACFKWESSLTRKGITPISKSKEVPCPEQFVGHTPYDRGKLKAWIKQK